MIRGQDYFELY